MIVIHKFRFYLPSLKKSLDSSLWSKIPNVLKILRDLIGCFRRLETKEHNKSHFSCNKIFLIILTSLSFSLVCLFVFFCISCYLYSQKNIFVYCCAFAQSAIDIVKVSLFLLVLALFFIIIKN